MNKENPHTQEAIRIKKELNSLGPEFASNGIVKTVLRMRIKQEKLRAKGIFERKIIKEV